MDDKEISKYHDILSYPAFCKIVKEKINKDNPSILNGFKIFLSLLNDDRFADENIDFMSKCEDLKSIENTEINTYYILFPIMNIGRKYIHTDKYNVINCIEKLNKNVMQLIGSDQVHKMVIPYKKSENESEEKFKSNFEIIKKTIVKLYNIKERDIDMIDDKVNDPILYTRSYYVKNRLEYD